MLSLRLLGRLAQGTVPRTAPRIASRQLSIAARRPVLSTASWRAPLQLRSSIAAPFSSTASRPQVLDELITKLDAEIQVERDISKSDTELSESIEEFLQSSGFQLHDTPGVDDVILTRKFGDEHIQVSFTIADLASSEGMERDMADDDGHLFDDEADRPLENVQGGGANKKGAINKGRTGASGDSVAPADKPELGDEDIGASPAFPARVNVKVTRDGQNGALVIEAVAQDGEIIIDNVYHFADKAIADPQNAEQEWKRKSTYAGPPFGNLDEGLQIQLENYLEERGVNTSMALFIPDYIDFKEQKEYIRWLENMRNFLA